MNHFFTMLFLFLLCYNIVEAQTNAGIPDASTVLIVYRVPNDESDTLSQSIMQYYVNARGIPNPLNVVPLNLPDSIDITIDNITHWVGIREEGDYIRDLYNHSIGSWCATEHAWKYFYSNIALPIKQHLVNNNLTSTIRYIVLAKGIPFKIQAGADSGAVLCNVTLDGLLCMLNTDNYETFLHDLYTEFRSKAILCDIPGDTTYQYSPIISNPYYNADKNYSMEHRFLPDHYTRNWEGYNVKLSYLVSHLNGISYDVVKGIIDRSVAADTTGEKIWILDGGGPGTGDITSASNILNDLGFDTEYNNSSNNWITTSQNEVIGYTSAGVHQGMDSSYIQDTLNFNYANGAVFNTYESFNGFSLSTLRRSGGGHGLMTEFTLTGGTGGAGHAWEPYANFAIQDFVFFPLYATGYSQMDAAWQGMPMLAWVNVFVGDPLTRILNYSIDTLMGSIVWNSNITIDRKRIVIPEGSSLTITNGAVVDLESNANLVVEGNLYIENGANVDLRSYSRIKAKNITIYPGSEINMYEKAEVVIEENGVFTMRENSFLNLNDLAKLIINGNGIIGNNCSINLLDNSFFISNTSLTISYGTGFTLQNSTLYSAGKLYVNGMPDNNVIFNFTTGQGKQFEIYGDSVNINFVSFFNRGFYCVLSDNIISGSINITNNNFFSPSYGILLHGLDEFSSGYDINITNNTFQDISNVGIDLFNISGVLVDSVQITTSPDPPFTPDATGILIRYCGDISLTNSTFDFKGNTAVKISTDYVDEEFTDNQFQGDIIINNLSMNGNFSSENGILVDDYENRIDSLLINNCIIENFTNGITLNNFYNFIPRIIGNQIIDYNENGILLTLGNEAVIRDNSIFMTNNPSTAESYIGIYYSQVSSPAIIGNVINGDNSSKAGPGIFSLSSNGSIRGNNITSHLYGIELGNSSPEVAENYITGNKDHGIFVGDQSVPNLSLTSLDGEGYPLTGYNNIFENGECEYDRNAEINVVESYIELSGGCNTIADDRIEIPEFCSNILLIDGRNVSDVIYAEKNYWGNHPEYGHDPTGRFREEVEIIYDGFLDEPCTYNESEGFFVMTSDGTVIDTVYSTGSVSDTLSQIEMDYSSADKDYYTNNFISAKQGYNQIINNYGSERKSLKAYTRLFQIEKNINSSSQSFNNLRNFYSSKLTSITDSIMIGVIEHLMNLCLVAEKEYIPAITNFENLAENNPNTTLAFYSELNALTTSLLLDSTATLGKVSAKYLAKGIDDYNDKVKNLFNKRRGINIENSEIEIPTEYSLYQNYPNPFNPTTVLRYDIPKQGLANLTVYNILGEKVKTLLNEIKNPGRYEVTFNAADLPSGVYIYAISTKDFYEAKKMILVR